MKPEEFNRMRAPELRPQDDRWNTIKTSVMSNDEKHMLHATLSNSGNNWDGRRSVHLTVTLLAQTNGRQVWLQQSLHDQSPRLNAAMFVRSHEQASRSMVIMIA